MSEEESIAGPRPREAPRLVLWNPPSPVGRTANREGFGGLGVLGETGDAFVYPSLRLAQVAGEARAVGLSPRILDAVLAPLRARLRARDLLRATHLVVQSAPICWASDLETLRRLRARGCRARLVVTGVALDAHAAALEAIWPGARMHSAPGGHGALALLGLAPPPPARFREQARPDWRAVPLGRSRRPGVLASRGCTRLCGYCPYVTATGRVLELRDPAEVAAECAALVRELAPRRLVFRDPTFGLDAAATEDLLARLAAAPSGARRPLEIETRADLLGSERIRALAAAGVVEVKLGVETLEAAPLIASGRVDDLVRAEEYADRARAAVRELVAVGLVARVFLLDGLPGMSEEAGRGLELAGVPVARKRLVDPRQLGGGAP